MKKYPSSPIKRGSSLKDFLDSEATKLFPNQDVMIKNHLNLIEYLEQKSPFLVLRKFKNHTNRGSIYSFENHRFTVSDNEPALWVFMETFNRNELNFQSLIKEQSFPIAFALKEEEKSKNYWKNIGRKHREFSMNGWKHCHIFQCSPLGDKITHYNDLKRRSLRLLSPLNHFPFFSPKKYEMPIDYGEDKECINFIIWWLYYNFYNENNKPYFKKFVEEQGFTIENKEPKDVKIYCEIKNRTISKNSKKGKTNMKSELSKTISSTLTTNTNKTYRLIKYFKLSRKWHRLGLIIDVKFNNGRTYRYNHDEVYENTINHFSNLDCWEKYGYYSSSNNIPKKAQQYVTEIF